MPELRSSAWSAVLSFPAPDGSRTLRVKVVNEVVEALQSRALLGIRQSYVWGWQSTKRLITETEVLTPNAAWMPLPEWLSYRGGASQPVNATTNDFRLPQLVIAHLKCGRIRSVKHSLEHDQTSATGIKEVVTIEAFTPDGNGVVQESLNQYMRRESAAVEMCVPLSSEEATAFFSSGSITGVRHSWINAGEPQGEHTVEIRSVANEWSLLDTNEVFVWNNVVTPHFRFTFTGGDRKKENINSPTPWVQ